MEETGIDATYHGPRRREREGDLGRNNGQRREGRINARVYLGLSPGPRAEEGPPTCSKMLVPVVLFFCLLSLKPAATEEGLGGKMLVFPTKTDSSYVKLTPKKPLSLSAFTLCMRVATELQGEKPIILFTYRTPEVDEINVWKQTDGRVALLIQSSSDGTFFSLPPLSTFQTHLCITWDSATGFTAFWVNGHRTLYQLYRVGYSVRPGGTVLLGQDCDNYLGGFDAEQSFVGEVTDVHMWDHVLSGSEIRAVYSNQETYVKGNVFDWSTIKYEITGDVLVVEDDSDQVHPLQVRSTHQHLYPLILQFLLRLFQPQWRWQTCSKMLVPVVLFFCLLSLKPAATEEGLGGKMLVFPTKTDSSYVKLTPKKPLSLSAFTLCMRVATELQGELPIILFTYRTPEVDEINVWKQTDGRLSLHLQSSGEGAFFSLPPISTFQTHLCVTWDSATGFTAFWVNGHRSLYQLYRKGLSIRPGGTVLLGQDCDNYLGGFDAEQSFVGEVTDVHMWDHVLSGSEIRAVYSNQETYVKGNVFDWNTIKYEITGDVLVVEDDSDQFWTRTLSPENFMDLAQLVLEIFQSEHGHSVCDAKTGDLLSENACWNSTCSKMLAVVLFLSLFFLKPVGANVGLAGKVLVFPTKSYSSYVKLTPEKPMSLSAFTLCMRVVANLREWRDIILFAYRTRDTDELNVWKEKDGRLSLYFQSSHNGVLFRVPPLSPYRTHLCVTWNSATGVTAVWVDGQRSAPQVYNTGHVVRAGGVVVLGQDPDSYLGDFETEQSFVGDIKDVYMWNYVLSDNQIKAAYLNKKANMPKGNIFDWTTIRYSIHGNVVVANDKQF
ncbi:hypothetical protein QQF64_021620 [Cirrhinus molitorella]|uniref:Pentraxin (PTX) domain-containing protein n=1 Tax=Cirrhinus molitorella TaxID=172907 RepID=A0ABR3L655_9TELE